MQQKLSVIIANPWVYVVAHVIVHLCVVQAVAGHPREAQDSRVVKMDVFWSMWMSTNVQCPWGSGKPACETTLLHHEQFKIPENLARFAVRHGMWGFVRKLASTVPTYVAARRLRVGPHQPDPQAYGAGFSPNPPLSEMSLSLMSSTASDCSESTEGSQDDGGCVGEKRRAGRRFRGLAAVVIASGLAVVLGARGNSNAGGLSAHRSRHTRRRRRHEQRTVVTAAE